MTFTKEHNVSSLNVLKEHNVSSLNVLKEHYENIARGSDTPPADMEEQRVFYGGVLGGGKSTSKALQKCFIMFYECFIIYCKALTCQRSQHRRDAAGFHTSATSHRTVGMSETLALKHSEN